MPPTGLSPNHWHCYTGYSLTIVQVKLESTNWSSEPQAKVPISHITVVPPLPLTVFYGTSGGGWGRGVDSTIMIGDPISMVLKYMMNVKVFVIRIKRLDKYDCMLSPHFVCVLRWLILATYYFFLELATHLEYKVVEILAMHFECYKCVLNIINMF